MKTLLSLLLGIAFSLSLSTASQASSTPQPNTPKAVAITSKLEQPIRTEAKAAKKKLTFKERIAKALVKRAVKKAKRKAEKRGIESSQSVFADIVVLAGAIVTIAGIIIIISSPLQGLIVAGLGLVVYLLGKAAGGSLNNIFR